MHWNNFGELRHKPGFDWIFMRKLLKEAKKGFIHGLLYWSGNSKPGKKKQDLMN